MSRNPRAKELSPDDDSLQWEDFFVPLDLKNRNSRQCKCGCGKWFVPKHALDEYAFDWHKTPVNTEEVEVTPEEESIVQVISMHVAEGVPLAEIVERLKKNGYRKHTDGSEINNDYVRNLKYKHKIRGSKGVYSRRKTKVIKDPEFETTDHDEDDTEADRILDEAIDETEVEMAEPTETVDASQGGKVPERAEERFDLSWLLEALSGAEKIPTELKSRATAVITIENIRIEVTGVPK